MANRIYIKLYNRITDEANYIIDSPLQEDVTLDIQTTYQDLYDLFPGNLEEITSLIKKGGQVVGKTGKALEDIVNQPIWQKTEPLKISTNLIFYNKTNPEQDVLMPALSLCSLNVLKDNRNGTYTIPGVSFSDAKNINQSSAGSIGSTGIQASKNYESLFTKTSKSTVCAVLIPGVIFLPIALCLASKPIFSKEVVSMDGLYYPLWCKIDLEIRSITPATIDMLTSQYGLEAQLISTFSLFS